MCGKADLGQTIEGLEKSANKRNAPVARLGSFRREERGGKYHPVATSAKMHQHRVESANTRHEGGVRGGSRLDQGEGGRESRIKRNKSKEGGTV